MSWPDFARIIDYREPWELRYWSRQLRIPIDKLRPLAESLKGDLQAIRTELNKRQ